MSGDTALVAAGQAWTVNRYDSTGAVSPYGPDGNGFSRTAEAWFKAPGLAGTDTFYLGISGFGSISEDSYNLALAGATGWNSAMPWGNQPGKSAEPAMLAWNGTIPYWMVANGRRLALVAKIGTNYESMYLGAYLPYGTPGQAPYPIMIAGTYPNFATRYSNSGQLHRAMFNPGWDGGGLSNSYVYWPDGTWLTVGNVLTQNQSDIGYNDSGRSVYPWISKWAQSIRENIDGTYTLTPAQLISVSPSGNVMGVFDGIYHVTNFNNSAENTITVGGSTYLVFPNIFRSNVYDYAAMLLA